MNIKIKKLHPDAVIPSYATSGSAGMDVTAIAIENKEDYVEYKTGLSFELPEGYVMLIFPRSSNSKKDLLLCNSVGVLDSDYRGELLFRYKRILRPEVVVDEQNQQSTWLNCNQQYTIGDKIGQIIIVPYPMISFDEVDNLSDSERGEGGFGSTDIKTDGLV